MLPQCFTILYQQTNPPIRALQVLNAKGEWVDAVPVRGSLVIKCVLNAGTFVFVLVKQS